MNSRAEGRGDWIARLTGASLRHWRLFVAAAALATAAGLWLASHLEVRSSFEELLPEDVPSVRHVKELARRVGGDGTILVVVEALDGPEGLGRAESMATRLAGDLAALRPDVVRAVEVDMRPVERWYSDHWPLFLPLERLRTARDDLVRELGRAKARVNPMTRLVDADDNERAQQPRLDLVVHPELRDLLDPSRPSPRARVARQFTRFQGGFMVHPDRRSVTVLLRPTGSSLGVGEVRVVLDRIQAVIDGRRAEAEAERLRIGVGGSYAIIVAEYETILREATTSFGAVLALVLLSIAAFYREVRPVLALGAAMAVAIAATFGVTWLAIGHLNSQTAFLGSIVAGNGINYGLVYLARVSQLRRRGATLEEACQEGARVAWRATLLAALGTSVAFGTLVVATNRGFRHFGFIGGIGMLLCWGATFVFLPAFLALLERVHPYRAPGRTRPSALGLGLVERALARPRLVVAIGAAATAAAVAVFALHLPTAMERNLDNLTNDATGGQELRRVHLRGLDALGAPVAGALALLPSRAAADAYCEALRRRIDERPALEHLIESCETISGIVPADQAERLALLRDIRERLTERVLAHLPAAEAERAREIRAQLAAQGRLTDEAAPPSLVDRFRERDGTVGRLAFVRAKADARLELGPNLREYAAAVRDVPVDGGRYDAAGTDIVASDLLDNIDLQGPRVTLLSFLAVAILIVAFFRTLARSALLLLSLTAGVALMAGVATVAGIKINFFNFIVYPITFGIAVDYGANVLARATARRSVPAALTEVGPVVVLCSWTTIVGYGSLTLSFNRALRSFGWYAILGELTTLITALVVLPAMALLLRPGAWMSPLGELPGGGRNEAAEESAPGRVVG